MTFAKKMDIRSARNLSKWKLISISAKHQQFISIHTNNHASIIKFLIIVTHHTLQEITIIIIMVGHATENKKFPYTVLPRSSRGRRPHGLPLDAQVRNLMKRIEAVKSLIRSKLIPQTAPRSANSFALKHHMCNASADIHTYEEEQRRWTTRPSTVVLSEARVSNSWNALTVPLGHHPPHFI
jgi:hypothetical protein